MELALETAQREGHVIETRPTLLTDNGAGFAGEIMAKYLKARGVRHVFGAPYHPQTQGKVERFHGELQRAVERRQAETGQTWLDEFRWEHNYVRPHEALGMAVPATRYQVSPVPYPETLAEPEYLPGDRIYKVDSAARIMIGRRRVKIGKAFIGQRIALRETQHDGVYAIWFGAIRIGEIDLSAPEGTQLSTVPT